MFSKSFHRYIEEYSKAHETGLFCVVGTTIHGYTFSMFLMVIFVHSNGKKMIKTVKNGQIAAENGCFY